MASIVAKKIFKKDYKYRVSFSYNTKFVYSFSVISA